MDILVAVAVGLISSMISTNMSLQLPAYAYGANCRHKSPYMYSALCSVVNKAGTTLQGHICMNNLSSEPVEYILVYCCV